MLASGQPRLSEIVEKPIGFDCQEVRSPKSSSLEIELWPEQE